MEECLTIESLQRLPDPVTTKILIGEVSLINATVIKKFLEKLGYQSIVQVDNGIDAVSYAEKDIFNVIFLDLRMPVIGGVEVTRLIRKHEKERRKISTTIVGLTAVYNEKVREHFYKDHGMDCLLRLPLHITDLRDVMEKYGHPKSVPTLKNLVIMYITNRPTLFQYTTKNPSSIFYKEREYFLAGDVLEDLHEMKESYPSLYKYPNFEGVDDEEILCMVSNDYAPLREGLERGIDASDIGAIRRYATPLAALLRHISPDSENVLLEIIACKEPSQVKELMETLLLFMDKVWD